ncbi:MAG: protein kinase, partial [Dehalococcoidia bacterium]|nr:protein kinase [Dehalococcoidia bacterium]
MTILETLGGRYRLLEPAGQGGMALVFKAQDSLLDRVVAIKVLRDSWAADADFVSRFRQEARAAARLSHPNIVAIYDVGEDSGRHYIVMEYIEGRSLKEELRQGPLNPLRIVEIGVQICSGLQYAHLKGIIHRDIKPHNILLCQDVAKIADFGIARAVGSATQTRGGEVLGSPQYLSPEQVKGEEATAASDIYSLGILLYEASTGNPPFQAESTVATALKHINETPVPPQQVNAQIPSPLEAIILKAMAKEPQRRFTNAAQMGQALSDCLARSREETTSLRAVPLPPALIVSTPAPAQAAPPNKMRQRRTKKTFSWGPVMASFALVALVAGLTLLSPTLVRRYLSPASSGSLPSPTPIAKPNPNPSPITVPAPILLALVPSVTGMLPQDAR